MELDRGQFQVLSNVLILDLDGVLDGHTIEELSCIGAWCDGGSTTKCLEDCLLDGATWFVHFDLELHYIAASRCANESSADICTFLVKWAYIAGVLVMVDHVLMVGESSQWHRSAHHHCRLHHRHCSLLVAKGACCVWQHCAASQEELGNEFALHLSVAFLLGEVFLVKCLLVAFCMVEKQSIINYNIIWSTTGL